MILLSGFTAPNNDLSSVPKILKYSRRNWSRFYILLVLPFTAELQNVAFCVPKIELGGNFLAQW